MDQHLVHALLDVGLAVLIAPAAIWLLWDLLYAFGGSSRQQPRDTAQVEPETVLRSPSR